MRIRLLGTNNAESLEALLSGVLIDESLALDAGLTRSLTHDEQVRVRHVLLTHQHYDHIRDVPALAHATTRNNGALHVYGLTETLGALTNHLLNGVVYLAYHEQVNADGTPRVALHPLVTDRVQEIAGYRVVPIPANHTCPAVGYLVTEQDGASLFYTGDTGPGIATRLQETPPDLLLTETTYPNDREDAALRNGHLTPQMLHHEIASIVEQTHWTPRVVVTHMAPDHQQAITQEIAVIRAETDWNIVVGHAGMILKI